ncbi:fructosamine kinase family protein [Virgibacillus sp. W0181]|uniref:fructosamine kinase family protein n=1 Tax=Virgibacillus sp. W0181 TaxID=3391581 RepID=UPI003F474FE0
MKRVIFSALHTINDHTELREIKQVSGGSINNSYYIETAKSNYFLKHHPFPPNNFFKQEANGLELIRKTDSICVPDVYAYSDRKAESYLLMEWAEGSKSKNTEVILGEKLAAMHQVQSTYHGFPEDTYIGLLHQPNGEFSNWLSYYRDQRLFKQMVLGVSKNKIQGNRRRQLEKLLNHLDKWIPSNVPASMLHGDLWGGNWMIGAGGIPYLIDPSILYGDRHFEIAFTELFGGFSQRFYDSYNAAFPLHNNYAELKPLYQLFYLLVHLNLFGEVYGQQVDRILEYYVGD